MEKSFQSFDVYQSTFAEEICLKYLLFIVLLICLCAEPISKFDVFVRSTSVGLKGYVACDGAVDQTSSINVAFKTNSLVHLGSGRCSVSDTIEIPAGGSLTGDGRLLTHLVFSRRAGTAADAVIRCEPREPGCAIRGLEISFAHPDTSKRNELNDYPPAIKIVDAPRTRVSDIRLTGARIGIDAEGNTGGLVVDDIEVSAFDSAIILDGALDTIRINNMHIWPFGLTKNQQKIMEDDNTIGIKSGRVDGLLVSELIALSVRKALYIFKSSKYEGSTFGSMVASGFDNASFFKCQGGARFAISASYWTIGAQQEEFNNFNDCNIMINSTNIYVNPGLRGPIFRVSKTALPMSFILSSSLITASSNDLFVLFLDRSVADSMHNVAVTGNIFQGELNAAETNSQQKIQVDGLRADQIVYTRVDP